MLVNDRQTIRYVLSLAMRAADRELITRYARILNELPNDIESRSSRVSNARPHLMLASATAVPNDSPGLPTPDLQEEYDLLFSAFVESGALSDAAKVAQDALGANLDPLIWHARLAQVSQWNNDPQTALKHWLRYALESNDIEAWNTVMTLAPQLEEDGAYLLAWKALHGPEPASEGGQTAALKALMARYVETGHWQSVLRVLDRLVLAAELQQKPELLLLRITATQQRAYQFAPEDPERQAFMNQLKALLAESVEHEDWSNEKLAWLAEMAKGANADAETIHYFRLLATRDPSNAAQWHRKLGDAQLAGQNYEAAAHAYFTARNAATSLEQEREFFQAGVNAFVSGNMLERAVDAATEEVDDLSDDPATLRYLIDLARRSGKPKLVAEYARRLLEVGRKKSDLMHPSALHGDDDSGAAMRIPLWTGDSRNRLRVDYGRSVHRKGRTLVASKTSSTEPDDYEIAFRAFVESQALDDAEQTAELAMANGQPVAVWAPRLAQVSQWNNHPAKAMGYWVMAAQETDDVQAWQAALLLAQQLDNVAVQLQALAHLAKGKAREPDHLMQLAELQHRMGNTDLAVQTLRSARSSIEDGPEYARFWRVYAQLSEAADRRPDADFAYRRLLATGRPDPVDLQRMAVFYGRHPLDSGRLAEMEFHQTGSVPALQRAMQSYLSVGAHARMEALLQRVPSERKVIERSPDLLIARAQHRFRQRQPEAGLEDLRLAVQSESATDQTRIAYLWSLVDHGSERELREAMARLQPLAYSSPEYLAVFGAGTLRTGDSMRAAQFFRRQRLARGEDPLWLIALASAEESAGHPDRARRIREEAWRMLPPPECLMDSATDVPTQAELATQLDVARILLAAHRFNADYPRSLLIRLLREDAERKLQSAGKLTVLGNIAGLPPLDETNAGSGAQPPSAFSAEARQAVLAWALASEQYPTADAWLATQYGDGAPADARLAVALAHDDKATVEELLHAPNVNLPIDSRVQAFIKTGDIAHAQTLAYRAAEGAPDSEGRHEVLVGTLPMTGERPSVGADVIFSDTEPLRYTETSVSGFLKLTQRQGVGVEVINRNQQSTDTDALAWVPDHDREVHVAFSDATSTRTIVAKAGYRNAWESFFTASLRMELRPDDRIKMAVELGLNQFTNISQALQVAAVKDRILFSGQWTPDRHWFAYGSAELARFRTQDRKALGNGTHLVAAVGYRLGGELSRWSLRAFTARGNYSAKATTVDSFQRLVPVGAPLQAEAFMPLDFTQYGAFLSYGTNDKSPYARRWSPFLEAGYIHDSNQGWGPTVHAGAGGPVLGKDHLRFFYLYSATPQGGGQRVRQVGLSYRLFF